MSNSLLVAGEGGKAVICRPALPAELLHAIAVLLGSPSRPAPALQAADFINTASARRINPAAVWVAESGGRVLWAVLPVLNPGRTLLLLTSAEVSTGDEVAAQLVEAICRTHAAEGYQLAQVLLESRYAASRQFFGDMGFKEIAELIYLQGSVPRSAAAPVLPQGMEWLSYSTGRHDLFARAIADTYRNSLDCPALSGLRDINDVIAGHRATGEFDPAAWQILMRGEQPLGVVLLSRIPHSDATELVYLGLAPEARGKGLGILMMRQVFFLILQGQRRRLSLAVDSKNEPALKLYFRFGMQQVATRVAMIRQL